jgi:hypothetical protein
VEHAGRAQTEIPESVINGATQWMSTSIARHQAADRQCWRATIDEVRALRARRMLIPEGTPV